MEKKPDNKEGMHLTPSKKWSEKVGKEWAEFCAWADENGFDSYLPYFHNDFDKLAYIENTANHSALDRFAELVDRLEAERITNLLDILDKESEAKERYTYNHQVKERPTKKWYAIRAYFLFCSNRKFGTPSTAANSAVCGFWRIVPCTEAVSMALTGEVPGEQLRKAIKKGEGLNGRMSDALMRHRWKAILRWKTNRYQVIERVIKTIIPGKSPENSVIAENDRRTALFQLRDSVAGAASKFREALLKLDHIEASRMDQILLQLSSLKVPRDQSSISMEDLWDWFHEESESALLHYIAELLAELYVCILSWDGTSYFPPRIMGATEQDDWLAVLIAAPFTGILTDSGMTKFISSGKEEVKTYRTKATTKLLQSGIAWIDTSRTTFQFSMKSMPMNISVLPKSEKADTVYARIWVSEKNRQLLHDFLETALNDPASRRKTRTEGDDHRTDKDSAANDRAYLIEMKSILVSAPKPNDADTEKIICMLVRLLMQYIAGCIPSGTPEQGMNAHSMLLFLCASYPDETALAIKQGKKSRGRPSRPGKVPLGDHYQIMLQYPNRLKDLIGKAENQEKAKYYEAFLLRCYNETIHAAHSTKIEALAIGMTLCFIQALTANWAERSKAPDKDGLLMDSLRPCKTALEQCKQEFCGDDRESFTNKFKESIDLYTASLNAVLCTLEDTGQRKNYKKTFQLQARTEAETMEQQKELSAWATGILRGQALAQAKGGAEENTICTQWFLDDLDSVTIAEIYDGKAGVAEAKMMKALTEAKNIVLTLPMLVDSKLMRSLTKSPEFLWAMRSGLINVSPYGNTLNLYDDLCGYAAGQMRRTYGTSENAFRWSSLSPALDSDGKAREAAAKYLLGKGAAPDPFRVELEEFREALILFDENIPYESRVRFYQTGAFPQLSRNLESVYESIQSLVQFDCVCSIHKQVVESIGTNNYVRSDYLKALSDLKEQESFDPESLRRAGRIFEDTYKRMLANCCPNVKTSFAYSDKDDLIIQILKEQYGPNDCIVMQESVTAASDQRSMTWHDLVEFRTEFARCAAMDPTAAAGEIARQLNIDFEVRRKKNRELLCAKEITLRTNDNTSYRVEITPKHGITRVQTMGGK